jgi:hypothetical protein
MRCMALTLPSVRQCSETLHGYRGFSLGIFIHQQTMLHKRSSVCHNVFTAMMPVETSRQVTLSYLTTYELKRRIGHIPFTGRTPCAPRCNRYAPRT